MKIGYSGLVISVATILAFLIGNAHGPATASTMAFATLCLSRLFHGFSCKSDEPILFTKKMFNNKFGILAFIAGLILLNCVLLTPGVTGLFKVSGLTLGLYGWIYLLAFGSFMVVQLIKFIISSVKRN